MRGRHDKAEATWANGKTRAVSGKQNARLSFFKSVVFCWPIVGFAAALAFADTGKGIVSGELKKWHRITITFDGPATSENAEDNPFLNYRLDVKFTNGKTHYIIPGFYAADGNAGQTSTTAGNKWRVHFVPDHEGQWSYSAIFSKGKGIALQPFRGEKIFAAGKFDIGPSDKTGRDHRAK